MAGYSGKSLVEKLGLKEGHKVLFLGQPSGYESILGKIPTVFRANESDQNLDFIHLFTQSRKELESFFPKFKTKMAMNGMIWISWPKKASKISTDLNENIVREIGLSTGLVDVKVCAIDETWSGLKFVIRLRDRHV